MLALLHEQASAWAVIWGDDFDTGSQSRINASNVTMTRVPDPIRTGTSMLFTDIGNAATWGAELSTLSGPNGTRVISFSDYGAVPGVDQVIFKFDIFVPTDSVMNGDTFGPYLRFLTDLSTDTGTATGASNNIVPGNLTKGMWHTIERTFDIPALSKYNQTGGSGDGPTTRAAVFVSFNDAGVTNAAGPLFYLDNFQVAVTPEPSKLMFVMCGLGALLLRRKRRA